MNRKDRRAQARQQRKEDAQVRASGYFQAMVRREEIRKAKKAELEKNGITTEDLERNYKNGYHDALSWATRYYQPFFYSAIAICLHRDLKFGET